MTTTSMIFIYYVLDTLTADGNFNSFFGWFYVWYSSIYSEMQPKLN